MNTKKAAEIQRGQAITFRLPSDTPDHLLKQLQRLKETERRNFSSKMAEFVLDGVGNSLAKERETVTIPLPKQLSKEQRNWLKHAHSEALLGSIVYQLLIDPVRATSVFATLNSTSIDIDEALYLQERDQEEIEGVQAVHEVDEPNEPNDDFEQSDDDDDLLHFDLDKVREEQDSTVEDIQEEVEEDPEDLLGDFLTRMNS